MSKAEMAIALNEWMRRFTEAPEQFEREFQTVQAFLAEQANGVEPTYGEAGASYMERCLADVQARAA